MTVSGDFHRSLFLSRGSEGFVDMRSYQNTLLRLLCLTCAGVWIFVDWRTVGPNCGGLEPVWARNGIRVTILAFVTALSGVATFDSSAMRSRLNARLTTYLALLLMAASSAYAIWRGYLMSYHNPDSWALEAELLLQIGVYCLVLNIEKLKLLVTRAIRRD
jgi:hypothetical protein